MDRDTPFQRVAGRAAVCRADAAAVKAAAPRLASRCAAW